MKKPKIAAKADTAIKNKAVGNKAEESAKPVAKANLSEQTPNADGVKVSLKKAPANATADAKPTVPNVDKAANAATTEATEKVVSDAKAKAKANAEALKVERKETKLVIASTVNIANLTGKKTIRGYCFAVAKALQDKNGSFTLEEWRLALVAQRHIAVEKFGVKNLDFTTKDNEPNGRCNQHTNWFWKTAGWVVPAETATAE